MLQGAFVHWNANSEYRVRRSRVESVCNPVRISAFQSYFRTLILLSSAFELPTGRLAKAPHENSVLIPCLPQFEITF
jgi:hypothetical protein